MALESLLRIDREDGPPDRTTFRLRGRLDAADLETLRAEVEACLAAGRATSLDLAELRFLDDSGAQLLCALCERGVSVTRATGYVRELLRAVENER